MYRAVLESVFLSQTKTAPGLPPKLRTARTQLHLIIPRLRCACMTMRQHFSYAHKSKTLHRSSRFQRKAHGQGMARNPSSTRSGSGREGRLPCRGLPDPKGAGMTKSSSVHQVQRPPVRRYDGSCAWSGERRSLLSSPSSQQIRRARNHQKRH